jgi:hypothetical protein
MESPTVSYDYGDVISLGLRLSMQQRKDAIVVVFFMVG